MVVFRSTQRRPATLIGLLAASLLVACSRGPYEPSTGPASASPGPDLATIRTVPIGTDGTPLGYVVRLPAGYFADHGRRWPTIVFLHGLGETGDGAQRDLGHLLTASLPALARNRTLPAQARGFVLLAPQTKGPTWEPQLLHAWLAAVLPRYRLDVDRIYLTGLSAGGGGAVSYVDTYGDDNEFAAVLPISSDWQPTPAPLGLPSCQRLAGTPLWAFVGALDDYVPHQLSINLVGYLDRHCQPREPARITVFVSTFHNAWERVYDLSGMAGYSDPGYDIFTTDPYTWFLKHTRSGRRHA